MPKIMCPKRQELENELNRANVEKMAAQKLIGVRKPDPSEAKLLSDTQAKYINAASAIAHHEAESVTSKCGCVL